jgi:hypothetical protein
MALIFLPDEPVGHAAATTLDAARLISGWSRLVDADDSSREIRHISMAIVNRVKRNFD